MMTKDGHDDDKDRLLSWLFLSFALFDKFLMFNPKSIEEMKACFSDNDLYTQRKAFRSVNYTMCIYDNDFAGMHYLLWS